MEKITTNKLVAYVVWVPQLNLQEPDRLQRNAHRYAHLIPGGPRIIHYSDPQTYTGKKYGPIIRIPYGVPAWDVYFVFGADVRWGDTPPTPTHWEAQIGGGFSAEYMLDGPRFAGEVRKLLAKIGQ